MIYVYQDTETAHVCWSICGLAEPIQRFRVRTVSDAERCGLGLVTDLHTDMGLGYLNQHKTWMHHMQSMSVVVSVDCSNQWVRC